MNMTVTDEDVNYDGLARLENYNVIITGSHTNLTLVHSWMHYMTIHNKVVDLCGR